MKIKIAILSLITIIITTFYFSAFTVTEKDMVIITQFGKSVKIIKKAGLYFKIPGFIQKINSFDKRVNLFETSPLQLLLSDKNPIIVSTYIAWEIDDPLLFFQSLSNSKNAQLKLNDMISSHLSMILSDY